MEDDMEDVDDGTTFSEDDGSEEIDEVCREEKEGVVELLRMLPMSSQKDSGSQSMFQQQQSNINNNNLVEFYHY